MTYEQLENLYIWAIVLYSTVTPLAVLFYLRWTYKRDFPGKRIINELRIEISDFSGMVADLTERFTRYQSKQSMRTARDAKEKDASILQQAKEIVAEGPAQDASPSKLDLYKRRRIQ